jgi:hypothetical protein
MMMHSLTHLPWPDESGLVLPNERPAVIMSSTCLITLWRRSDNDGCIVLPG